jgi:t-SNARE complex subunit (syntaxin)
MNAFLFDIQRKNDINSAPSDRKYYAGQKILAVIVCQFKKKKNCNPYFIVIMITVLIMNVIFWVVNFKTQNYFVIFSTTQNVYLRLSTE